MEAGKLEHEILIQQRADTRDSIGGSVANWTTYSNCYAAISNGGGSEATTGDQINAVFDTTFKVRYDSGIRSSMRIVHRSRNYNIVDWNETLDGMEEMHLFCKRQEDATNG